MLVGLHLRAKISTKGRNDKIGADVFQEPNNVVLPHIIPEKLSVIAMDGTVAVGAKRIEIVAELLVNGIANKSTAPKYKYLLLIQKLKN